MPVNLSNATTTEGSLTGFNGILPGTTIPESAVNLLQQKTNSPTIQRRKCLKTFPGPNVNGKPTTLTVYDPWQLIGHPILLSLYPMINTAYRDSHVSRKILTRNNLPTRDRLQHENAFLQEIGADPGTFTIALAWAGTDEAIATISAHRYVSPVAEAIAEVGNGKAGSAFRRVQVPAAVSSADVECDIWELKLMAVDIRLQKQGLASYLMKLAEEEIAVRFTTENLDPSLHAEMEVRAPRRLWVVITTLKEANWNFYQRRGYRDDYETSHEAGFLGSETGFTVVHMSKELQP
ncbi:hypothetical protein M433DRAFT_157964 [Acidomyces richmondensis BFW]|nr:MAG: hypothetical protein FE78DRAFT_84758 [Acidomyces sp. 'richmondensis']KYG42377.1 hypothetical protein M433DRAFT_157964 [Acidomyces richmondensis BFW]